MIINVRITGLQNRGSQVRVLSPLWLYQAKSLVNRVIAGLRRDTAKPRKTPHSYGATAAKATANLLSTACRCLEIDFVSSKDAPWVEFRCPTCGLTHWLPF